MSFTSIANFICFSAVQKLEARLRFDKVTDSLKVGTFLRHIVDGLTGRGTFGSVWPIEKHGKILGLEKGELC